MVAITQGALIMSWQPLNKGHIASSSLNAHKTYFSTEGSGTGGFGFSKPLGVSHWVDEGILRHYYNKTFGTCAFKPPAAS